MANELYNIQIISPYTIKKILPQLPSSIPDELMDASIIECQEQFILSVLGEDLYQQILLEHSGETLTTPNEYIYLRFIVKILSYRVVIKLIYDIQYQFEAAGVRIKTSDQSVPAERTEMIDLIHRYESTADSVSQSMILYINENITDYSLFLTSTYCTARSDRTLYSRLNIGGF